MEGDTIPGGASEAASTGALAAVLKSLSQHGGPPVRVVVISSRSELLKARGLWESLWNVCEHRTPFLSYDWLCSWAGVYGEQRRLNILVITRGDEPAAIVPLALVRHACGVFSVDALETAAGDSRNLIALVRPGVEAIAARVFCEYLRHQLRRGTECAHLKLVPSDAPFLEALTNVVAMDHELDFSLGRSSAAPYVRLPAEWGDYWRTLSSARRKTLRRMYRRLTERHHVSFEHCVGSDALLAMEELYRLHQGRWKAVRIRGLFGDDCSRGFHTTMVRNLQPRGWAEVTRLRIDGEVISVHLVLTLDGVLYFLRSGRSLRYQNYGIGHLHDMMMMQRAVGRGMHEVDFLRGTEPYKYYWARDDRTYVNLVITRRTKTTVWGSSLVAARLRVSAFLEHRHTPSELVAILRIRWREAAELRSIDRARARASVDNKDRPRR
ncbi:MAG: GNAT family N-acetyltransferase [Chloroflexota bacterium]